MISAKLEVQITRFVDDHFPGWVECSFADSAGTEWLIREKVPMVTLEDLDEASSYPQLGSVACHVISRQSNEDGSDTVEIDTGQADHIESVDGTTRFVVSRELVHLDSD